LVIGAQRGNGEISRLWGADISSLPSYAIRTAPPGLYQTACHLYGDDCGGSPREVSLTHDGLIVQRVDEGSALLYYWDGDEFKNVVIVP
jgi:hypothetical protein